MQQVIAVFATPFKYIKNPEHAERKSLSSRKRFKLYSPEQNSAQLSLAKRHRYLLPYK